MAEAWGNEGLQHENLLQEAIAACEKIVEMPDNLSPDWKTRKEAIGDLVRILSGLSSDDRERFLEIVHSKTSFPNKDLFDIMSAVNEAGGGENVVDVDSESGWEAKELLEWDIWGMPEEMQDVRNTYIGTKNFRWELMQKINHYLDKHAEELWYKVYKEHPENEEDNSTRIEFTIGWYRYKVLLIDGKAHAGKKYQLKSYPHEWAGWVFKIHDVNSVWIRDIVSIDGKYQSFDPLANLNTWNDRDLAEYIQMKKDDGDFDFLNEDEFNSTYAEDFRGVADDALGVFLYLTGLSGNHYICKVSEELEKYYSNSSALREFGTVFPWWWDLWRHRFDWEWPGKVWLVLLSRTKV